MMDFQPAPMDRDVVLDPVWLTEALQRGGRSAVVSSVELVESIGWNALTLRVRLGFDGDPGDVPEQVCVKGLFGERRQIYLDNGPLEAESIYYRDVAPEVGLNSPRCFYAGVDHRTRAGVVVLEDLTPLGVRFFSGLDRFSVEQTRQSMEQLAILHGRTWAIADDRWPSITPKTTMLAEREDLPRAMLTDMLHDPRGVKLPDYMRDGGRVYAAMGALGRMVDSGPYNIMHGDDHLGNFYDVAGRIGIFDWQILQRGAWSLDVAYHLGSVLTVEDRRAHEVDLLNFYLDRVRKHGGTPPAWDEAWAQYRRSFPYGFYMWATTRKVEIEIIASNVTRLGTAIADHAGYKLLGIM